MKTNFCVVDPTTKIADGMRIVQNDEYLLNYFNLIHREVVIFVLGETGIPEIIDFKAFINSAVIPNFDFQAEPVSSITPKRVPLVSNETNIISCIKLMNDMVY